MAAHRFQIEAIPVAQIHLRLGLPDPDAKPSSLVDRPSDSAMVARAPEAQIGRIGAERQTIGEPPGRPDQSLD